MASHHAVMASNRAQSEARIVFGLAMACTVAFGVFVMLPHYAGFSWVPAGIGPLWMLGMIFSIVLGPVAAGIAGYASFVALWVYGGALPTHARRLHLVTLLIAVSFLTFFATWGADALSGWAD